MSQIKFRAWTTIRDALASGIIHKEPCEVCGHLDVDAHHDDYASPLKVRWLCRKHHAEHHKGSPRLSKSQIMTPEELRTMGEAIWGYGWQTRMAETLKVNGGTARRWVSGKTPVPGPVDVALRLIFRMTGKDRD